MVANRCLLPVPECLVLLSESTGFCCFGFCSDHLHLADGEFFRDGSCFAPRISKLGKAGWAVVQTDELGSLVEALYGGVPSAVAWTSLAAQHTAFWVAFENSKDIPYGGDG